jgi:RNA polymerase sigma-70 factor (ECF subfamily)
MVMPAAPIGLLRSRGEPSLEDSAWWYGANPLSSFTDARLIELATGAHGGIPDSDAFGFLYERHVSAVYAFAYGRLRDQMQAEDITSQTFLQALHALPRYRPRGVPFCAWLLRITANLLAGLHRQLAVTRLHAARDEGYQDESARLHSVADPADRRAEAQFASWEVAEDLRHLLGALTPGQRAVVRLRFDEDLSIAEIACRMACSEGAVKARLYRALGQLRRGWREGVTGAA